MMIQYLSFIGKVLFLMSGCRNAFLNCHCLDKHFPMSALRIGRRCLGRHSTQNLTFHFIPILKVKTY